MSNPWRIVQRYAKTPQPTASEFAEGFFNRHPQMQRFKPAKVLDSQGSRGHEPEAFQKGDDVYLCPKFWQHDAELRDWMFAHELGHYALSRHETNKLIDDLNKLGVDPWDSPKLPYSQFNMDEAFADCFAEYFLNRSELKRRYPEWEAVVHALVQ